MKKLKWSNVQQGEEIERRAKGALGVVYYIKYKNIDAENMYQNIIVKAHSWYRCVLHASVESVQTAENICDTYNIGIIRQCVGILKRWKS